MREENKRLEHEAMVARMEQEELELIQRLQNTQLLQKAAYEDLENALVNQSVQGSQMGDRPGTTQQNKGGRATAAVGGRGVTAQSQRKI